MARRALPFPILVVGALYLVLTTVMVLASLIAEIPSVVSQIAGIGMTLNILASLAVGYRYWVVGVKDEEEPQERDDEPAYATGEGARDLPSLHLDDISTEGKAPLSALKKITALLERLDGHTKFDAIELVKECLSVGFAVGASDVHMTPNRDGMRVTYRVDGVLHDVGTLDQRHCPRVINRIKVMARLLIHVRSKPQDGRIAFDREEFQVRVSLLPTNHGEKAVMRLAVNDERRYDLDRLGLPQTTRTLFETLLQRDHGVIYLTGPTGSGKTTTMYASMREIRKRLGEKVNIATLEDPIEVDFRGITQTQVDNAVGLTFANGLRALLRQDPDIIMVGEIRDEETAQTAIRAGLTGHLLLTSVHADSTVGVINRLKQLKVDPFQLSSASIAVLNQRLAIRNCPHCTVEKEPTRDQIKQLELLGIHEFGKFYVGKGCSHCRGSGRLGRLALVELLPISDGIRDLIVSDTSSHQMVETAQEEGMLLLAEQAMVRANDGELPIDEVIRVLSF